MNETKIKAWVARSKNNSLCVYFMDKPEKERVIGDWSNLNGNLIMIPENLFPQVKWSDEEPTEVELVIKTKRQWQRNQN